MSITVTSTTTSEPAQSGTLPEINEPRKAGHPVGYGIVFLGR